MQTNAEIAALHFASYNVPGALYAAPGRVNLIGEHTEYSDGFVMPAAIDFATVVAISPRTDGRILVHSVNYDERIDQSIPSCSTTALPHCAPVARSIGPTIPRECCGRCANTASPSTTASR